MGLYEFQEVKIEKTQTLGKDHQIITLKLKLKNTPGRFLIVSTLGFGESPIYIASENNDYTDLIIEKKGNNTKKITELKSKDKLLVRGPYGRGFSINNLKKRNIYLIIEGTGIGAARSLIQHMLQSREEYKNVNIYAVFNDAKSVILSEELDFWNQRFHLQKYFSKETEHKDYSKIIQRIEKEIIPQDSIVIISTTKQLLKKILLVIDQKDISKKRVYFTHERNMQCGVGKCGTCLIHGKKTCLDGPVFRYDELNLIQKEGVSND